MKYDKLVRDKIPEIIKSKGGLPITHIANDTEYWQKLKEKLQEEVSEFIEAQNIEEMADILEVVDAIFICKNFDERELKRVKEDKARERGKFNEKIILEES
jgi:predicted house-cleaning noncanonical NTP pyrophosphatase (MazG superfamily)